MRKKTILLAAACTIFAAVSAVSAFSSPGSQSDPLIPLSYINGKFIPGIIEETGRRADTGLLPAYDKALEKLDGERENWLLLGENAAVYKAVSDRLGVSPTGKLTDVSLKKGDLITGRIGTGFMLRTGGAAVSGPAGSALVNISQGSELASGKAVSIKSYYMAVTPNGAGLKITSGTAVVAVSGRYSVTPAYKPKYVKAADALHSLNLFKGTSLGYELDRPATRIEALVMLIRLLGEEDEASGCADKNPFTDVPGWAAKYAAYAYAKGYTTGTSPNRFSPASDATLSQYMTFILRALSYSDADGDFSFKDSLDFSVKAGIFSQKEKETLKNGVFYRDQAVYASVKALSASLKGGDKTLAGKLISEGVFTQSAFDNALSNAGVD